jgi:hypothetical protein
MDVTVDDVHGYLHVYGNIPSIRGKMVDMKTKPRQYVPSMSSPQQAQLIHWDLMFCEGEIFFIAISEPLGLITVRHLASKRTEELKASLDDLSSLYSAYKMRIDKIIGDNERGMKAIKGIIGKQGVLYDSVPPTSHDPVIERAIRTVKDSMRSVIASLPFPLPPSELPHLAAFCVSRLNMLPSSTRVDPSSPLQLLTGQSVKADTLGPAFGVYCEVFTRHKNNSMAPRSTPALSLGATGGSLTVNFLDLTTGHYFQSVKYKELNAVPDHVIQYMSKRFNVQRVGHVESERVPDNRDRPSSNPQSSHLIPENVRITESVATPDVTTAEPQSTQSEINTELNQDVQRDEVPATYHISVAKGIQQWGSRAHDAIKDEMRAMLDKEVFEPVSRDCVSKRPIISFMFLKEKKSPDGQIQRIKARLVAGGHMQDRALYEDLASPTCATQTLFIVAAIAVKKKWLVTTADIGTAYLNAHLIREDIFMTLDEHSSSILNSLDSRFIPHHVSKKITVRLRKALYGCVESALLWYKHLDGTLKEAGFERNLYDRCLYVAPGIHVLIYVDDLFIASESEEKKDKLIKLLREKYKAITLSEGKIHSYLGMKFNFSSPGQVSITMLNQIEEALQDMDVKEYATPATNDLFDKQTSNNKLLNKRQAEFFHSKVAKLLYIAKRTRPDILLSVSFLTTKVRNPTETDFTALNRTLGYLKRTKDEELVIKPREDMQCSTCADASHAVHPDARSHSGNTSSIGGGAIYTESKVEDGVTRSSSESELKALDRALPQVIWLRNLLTSLGFPQKPTVIFQDNKSTIILSGKGYPCSKRTRHINIQFFRIKQYVENFSVTLKYLPTEEMLADILTKPLQGQLFRKFASQLLRG